MIMMKKMKKWIGVALCATVMKAIPVSGNLIRPVLEKAVGIEDSTINEKTYEYLAVIATGYK